MASEFTKVWIVTLEWPHEGHDVLAVFDHDPTNTEILDSYTASGRKGRVDFNESKIGERAYADGALIFVEEHGVRDG